MTWSKYEHGYTTPCGGIKITKVRKPTGGLTWAIYFTEFKKAVAVKSLKAAKQTLETISKFLETTDATEIYRYSTGRTE